MLIAFTVFRPLVSGEKFSTVSREAVIEIGDETIIQFVLLNREGKDTTYVISWSTGGKTYSQRVLISDDRELTIIRHFYPETVKEGQVYVTIRREGEATPFEESTYYIRFDEQ